MNMKECCNCYEPIMDQYDLCWECQKEEDAKKLTECYGVQK